MISIGSNGLNTVVTLTFAPLDVLPFSAIQSLGISIEISLMAGSGVG
jgi:hypothetical protein